DYRQSGTTTAWVIYRADPVGLGGTATFDGARITFQEPDAAGGWRTRRELPDLPAEIGLRASTKLGRGVPPASDGLKTIESRPPGFDLTAAQSSRLGAFAADSSATTGATLLAGDTLRLAFTSTTAGEGRGEDCFFIASRPLAAGELMGRRAP